MRTYLDRYCFYFLVVGLAFVQQVASAQEIGERIRFRQVKAKGGHFFIYGDSAIFVVKDTTFVVPDTAEYFQRRRSLKKSKNFYQSVNSRVHRNIFSKLLYKVCFEKKKEKKSQTETPDLVSNEDPYMDHYGKLVKNMRLKRLEIFGTDVTDTSHTASGITAFLNGLHRKTSKKIILNSLLIAPGSRLEPAELGDNERLLRRLPYIKDSRIYVLPRQDSPEIDLLLVTKDVFPYRFDVTVSNDINRTIGVSNINLFGMGHEFSNTFIPFDKEDGSFGWDATYRVPRLGSSFVSGQVNYASSFAKDGVSIKFFRDFLSADIRYAGGIEVGEFTRQERRFIDLEIDSTDIVRFESNTQDVWVAKAVKSYSNPPVDGVKERVRMILAAGFFREHFSERPIVRRDTNQIFHNRHLFLLTFGFSTRRYFKDYLIKSFGRTEDIPIGNLIQVTAGYEFSEFMERAYAGFKWADGRFVRGLGYVRLGVEGGGFFRGSRFEQGVAKFDISYFSRLYSFNYFHIRQFLTLNYTLGVRRKDGEFLDISINEGIRGIPRLQLGGTQRVTINAETVLFTPAYFGGFRLAVFGFADLGIIESNNESILKGVLFKGFGFGVRLKNENLAFNIIQLRFGFFSGFQPNVVTKPFNFSTQANLPLADFDVTKPAVLEFR